MLQTGTPNVSSTKARVAVSMGSPVNESLRTVWRYRPAAPELFIIRKWVAAADSTVIVVVLERAEQAHGIELPRHGPGGHSEGEGSQRAVPEPVAPGRGRRAEEPVARADAGAVERGDHEHDDGPVRVPHGGGQLARGAGRVLEDGEVVRCAAQLAARGVARQRGQQRIIGHDHVEVLDAARRVRLLGVRDEEPRRAVLDAEPHAVRRRTA